MLPAKVNRRGFEVFGRLGAAAFFALTLAVLAGPALADKIDDAQAAFADYDEATAMKLLNEVLAETSDAHVKAVALFNRGEVWASKGDYEKAAEDFTSALGLPQDPSERAQTLVSRAETYNRRNRNDEALKDYTASLELAPEQLGVRTARGQLYQKIGDKAAALADFDAELKNNPKYYRALVGRALILDLPLPPDPTRGRR